MSVAINPPKTPVTKGSNGIAAATVPNICKMPGPPAPFVPTPLPNIGRSSLSPKGYSKKVKIKGNPVAIKGATFASQGDIASKALGGGLVSANTHGPTKFVGPGSLDVKIEGKNVQLLSDPMLNNCGPSGNPPNSATLQGVIQETGLAALWGDEECPVCNKAHNQDKDEKKAADAKLEESGDTKAACDSVQNAVVEFTFLTADEVKAKKDGLRLRDFGMLGAVECKCHKVHFAQSNRQRAELRPYLKSHHHLTQDMPRVPSKKVREKARKSGKKYKDSRRDRFDLEKLPGVAAVYDKMLKKFDRDVGDEKRFLPGTCAAQQAMLLTIDHECIPKFLTERKAKGKRPGARRMTKIMVRDLVGKTPSEQRLSTAEDGLGVGEKAVPPCATCREMLPALMCNLLGKPCKFHTSDSCGQCPKKK